MKRGMGAYMGVAQGAVFPPKFIHLTYRYEVTLSQSLRRDRVSHPIH